MQFIVSAWELPYRKINHPAGKLNHLFKSEILTMKFAFAVKGIYRGGKGAMPHPRPVKKGVAPPLELRAFTLFKS